MQSDSRHVSTRLPAIVAAAAFFMEMLDGTVITPALSAIGRSFHVSALDAGQGVTIYLLAAAVAIPFGGWLSDRYGARAVLCTAIAEFTFASVLCATSQTLWQFAGARILQGAGGALMVPVGRSLVLRGAAKADLMAVTAIFTWPGLIAPVLGPPIGGVITTCASWRLIFLINVPLGLITLVSALLVVKAAPAKPRPFDGAGCVLNTVSIASLVYGIGLAGGQNTSGLLAGGLIVAALAVGAIAVRHALRHPAPLVDLSPLRVATYAASFWEGSLMRLAIFMVPFLLPLLLQVGFRLSPVTSGLLVLTVFAGNLLMKTITTATVRHFGFRPVLAGNGVLAAASLAACALFSPSTPYAVIAAVCFLGGASRSLEFTAANTLAFADIPARSMNAASTLYDTVTQLSAGMGVALAATVVQLSAHGHPPTAADFRTGFLVGAGIALAGALLFLRRLAPSAGAEVSAGRRAHLPTLTRDTVVTFDALHTVRANMRWRAADKVAHYTAVVKRRPAAAMPGSRRCPGGRSTPAATTSPKGAATTPPPRR